MNTPESAPLSVSEDRTFEELVQEVSAHRFGTQAHDEAVATLLAAYRRVEAQREEAYKELAHQTRLRIDAEARAERLSLALEPFAKWGRAHGVEVEPDELERPVTLYGASPHDIGFVRDGDSAAPDDEDCPAITWGDLRRAALASEERGSK